MSALRRIPAAALWCAAIAFVNVAAWGIVTPAFQVPDETIHVAYVQHLAENGEPPNDAAARVYADQEARLLESLLFNLTAGRRENGTIWYELQENSVEAAEKEAFPQGNGGGLLNNSSQPPLFFLLESVPYHLSPWDGLLERVALMRLLSALFAALTTLFVFMFVREVLSEPWTWTIGALAVAFQPVFGFISGGVQPDALLFTASAGLLWMLARTFRNGLTLRRGLAIGAFMAVGAMTKLTFLGLLPGAFLGLAILGWRLRPRIAAVRPLAGAAGVLALVSLAYLAVNVGVWDRSAWGGAVAVATSNAGGGGDGVVAIGLTERLGYTWQLFFPPLPTMVDQFSYFPPYTTWLKGFVGVFGWLDTGFPEWVYTVSLFVFIPLALLAAWALVQRRAVLRERWPELLTYLAMAAGLALSIGFSGSRYRKDTGFVFEQARYLLPLLPLYATAVGLAALGAGRRFGRPLGAAIVVLALAHSVFAQMVVIARFYA